MSLERLAGFHITIVAIGVVLFMSLSAGASANESSGAFVTTSGTQFVLGGKPYYVTGTNNHYIHFAPFTEVDRVLEHAAAMGLNVVRMWGFLDIGSPGTGGEKRTAWHPYGFHAYDLNTRGVYFQYWDDETGAPAYNDGPDGLERLDYAIAKARELGLKVIVTLSNNWLHMGGIPQYNEWFSTEGQLPFFTDPRIRQAYKDWVEHVVTRVNTYTGIPYRDDPTIFAWELINEPHIGGGTSPQVLTRWVAEMSAFIKQLDPNHMVALGDEGFFNWKDGEDRHYDGSASLDFDAILSLPTIDFGTYHLYPDWWEKDPEWGVRWIRDHIEAGSKAGKPVVLGEFGWQDEATKAATYTDWIETIYEMKGGGWQFWRLVAPTDAGIRPNDTERFDIYYPSEIASVLADLAARFRELETEPPAAQTDRRPGEFRQISPGANAAGISDTPSFQWEAAEGAVQYAVLVASDPDFVEELSVYVTNGTALTLPDSLARGRTYYWQVIASNEHGQTSAANAGSSFTVKEPRSAMLIDDFSGYRDDQALQSVYRTHPDGNEMVVYLDHRVIDGREFRMRFEYKLDGPDWGGVERALPWENWSGATGIQFWWKPDGSRHSMTIQFGQATGDYWEAYVPIQGKTEPELVQLPFDAFVRPAWNTGGIDQIELSLITSFAIYIGRTEGAGTSGAIHFGAIELMTE